MLPIALAWMAALLVQSNLAHLFLAGVHCSRWRENRIRMPLRYQSEARL